MSHELNLARRPFLNPRPVVRVTLLLWLVGLAVAGFNVRLYLSHYSGSSENRDRQRDLQTSLERERGEVAALEAELAGYDVEFLNEQAAFLNSKISERSFSWSNLFDRLAEVMPADLRLVTLSPSFESESRRGRTAAEENEVVLGIRGTALSSEVVLAFVDALFSHRSFRAPNLSKESLRDDQLVDFSLSVIYAAHRPPAEAVAGGDANENEASAPATAGDDGTGEGAAREPAAAAPTEVTE